MKDFRSLNFDLKQLRSFMEVVEHRSFTKASRRLRLGQATVSMHTAALEEALGVSLIRRTSRAFTLTPEGRLFHAFCERLFEELESLRAGLSVSPSDEMGTLAASTIPSAYVIPMAIAGVRKKTPGMRYRIEVGDSREVIEMVREGSVEFGIVGRMMKNPALVYEKILHDEIVLAASPSSGIPDQILPEALGSIQLIMREKGSGTRDAFERGLSARGIAPSGLSISLECTTSEGVRQAAAAGLGAAVISRLAVEGDIAAGRLMRVRVKGVTIKRDFYLVYAKRALFSKAAMALIDNLKKVH